MKNKTRKVIGNFLIIGIVFLIVFIFSIWYYAKFVRKNPEMNSEATSQVAFEQDKPKVDQVLTKNQLEEISNQLNTAKDNPFVVLTYEDVTKVELSELLYNGAGISSTILTENEKMQLTEKMKKDNLNHNDPFSENEITSFLSGNVLKMKRTDIEKYLKEKTGTERSVSKEETGLGYYLESEDSYYIIRTDTSFRPVFCDEGKITPEGIYQVKYHDLMAEGSSESYTVQMKKVNDQFVFLSNLKNEE